jgi:hypothetical protein
MAQKRQELEKELVVLAQKGAFGLIAQNLEDYEYFVRFPSLSLHARGDDVFRVATLHAFVMPRTCAAQCAENPKDSQPLYSAHLLTYPIENEIHSARFLWRRIPKKIKETDPELNAIWTIGQNVWNKKYTEIYQSAQAYNWSPGTVLFVQAFVEKFRERTFKLVSSAYSNISTADLATLLGLGEQDAIKRTIMPAPSPFSDDQLSSSSVRD